MSLRRVVRSNMARIMRALPVRGRWRLVPGLNGLFPVETVETWLPDVGHVRLDLSDEDYAHIYWVGLHREDPEIIRLIQESLPPDGIFFDVGANIGIHTLAAARRVAAGGGAVVAFEPHPSNLPTLKHNIERNGLHHVMVHDFGLAEAPDVLTCQGTRNGGNWSLASRGEYTFQVRLMRLDDYLEEHPVPRLDMLKIDVEGAEVRVLRGATRTIARFRPLIAFEVCRSWLERMNSSVAELLATVEGLGYTIHALPRNGRPHLAQHIVTADLIDMSSSHWTNLVAVPSVPPTSVALSADREEAALAKAGDER
jgi:FkbM family methyltransferase